MPGSPSSRPPVTSGWPWPWPPSLVGVVGAAVERTCLRPLYRRGPLDQVLLTFGLIYVFEDLVKWIWGGRIRSISTPDLFSGSVKVWGATIPSYRLFVIAFGLAMAVALWLLIERTRLGAIIRAGVFDSEMSAGMGINIQRVFTLVFAFGAALAGLSGVIAGPIQSAYPAHGRLHPHSRAHRGRGGRAGQPEGVARGKPHHRPGRDLREGVAARRLDAHDLRRHGPHPPVPAAGALRPGAPMIYRALGLAALVARAAPSSPSSRGTIPSSCSRRSSSAGIFAMSLDLLMGYAGMVSFGHSAFFGIGAYTAALALAKAPGLLAALVLPAAAAGVGRPRDRLLLASA